MKELGVGGVVVALLITYKQIIEGIPVPNEKILGLDSTIVSNMIWA